VLLTIGIVLVIALAVAVGLLAGRGGPSGESPEQQAGESGRSSPSGVPVATGTSVLGSGGSATSDWYQLYFTDPKYPDNPADHQGGLDTRLTALIDTATRTLDVADYDFDLADVAQAMARAQSRGVRVRMVTDTDTLEHDDPAIQAAFKQLKDARIPIVDDQRSALMHDKFTIVDSEWVSTGSWNYTDGDTYHLNNNLIVMHSRDLAANYTTEFERLFLKREFGPSKSDTIPHPTLSIEGAPVQNCFSPSGHCADLVVQAVNGAQHSIDFMAFSYTDKDIGAAMLARATAGVTVRGVFETTGSQTSSAQYGPLKQAGLEVYTDGNPWVMHHKVIIIDQHIVIFGSYNFTASANTSNNENLLIIDDRQLAQAFEAEFARVLEVAKNPPVRP
jgi:phosphatidylserine/phosphatidylglycerophosphate/cardiolipin synthase-like enzyme